MLHPPSQRLTTCFGAAIGLGLALLLSVLVSGPAQAQNNQPRSVKLSDGRVLLGLVLESTAEGMMLEIPQGQTLVRYEALVEIGVVPDSEFQQQTDLRIGIAPVAAPDETDASLTGQLNALLAEAVALIPATEVLSAEAWLETLGETSSELEACRGDLRCARRHAAGLDLVYVLVPTITGVGSQTPRMGLTALVASTGTTVSAGEASLTLRDEEANRINPALSGQGVLEAAFAALAIQPRIDVAAEAARTFPPPPVLPAMTAVAAVDPEALPSPTAESDPAVTPAEPEASGAALAESAASDASPEAADGVDDADAPSLGTATGEAQTSPQDAESPVAVTTDSTDQTPTGSGSAEDSVEQTSAPQPEESDDMDKGNESDTSATSAESTEQAEESREEPGSNEDEDIAETSPSDDETSSGSPPGDSTAAMETPSGEATAGAESAEAMPAQEATAESDTQQEAPTAAEAPRGDEDDSAPPSDSWDIQPESLETRPISDSRASGQTMSQKQSIALGFLPVPGLPSALAGDVPGFIVALAGTVGASWATIYAVGRVAPTAGAFWGPSIVAPYAFNVAFNQVCGAVSRKVKGTATPANSAASSDEPEPTPAVSKPQLTTTAAPLVAPGPSGRTKLSGAGFFFTGRF